MKFLVPLGIVGSLIYWAISALLFFAPIGVLDLPTWAEYLLLISMFLPFVGILLRPVLYVVAMFFLSDAPDRAVIIFWVSFAVFVITEFIPTAIHAVVCFREVNRP